MNALDQARAQYDGKSLTARWEYARGVTPEDAAAVRQAAREELSAMLEEIADHGGSSRIVRLARRHIAWITDRPAHERRHPCSAMPGLRSA